MEWACANDGLELWRFESADDARTYISEGAISGVPIEPAAPEEWEWNLARTYSQGAPAAAVLVVIRQNDRAEVGRIRFDAPVADNNPVWVEIHPSMQRHHYATLALRQAFAWFCGWHAVERIRFEASSARSVKLAEKIGAPLERVEGYPGSRWQPADSNGGRWEWRCSKSDLRR